MATKILSIEVGQQTTKICELDYQKKNPRIYNCITFDTPEGCIDDGYIKDKVGYATILREHLDAANIKNDKVVFTISSTKIANREAIIPFVKDNRIEEIVMANAGEYFPVNIDEYNISYSILEKSNTKEEKQIRLLVLAAPGNLIKTYFELADMMRLNIVAIDYVGNSTFQLLRNQISTGVNLVVQINDQNTIINLLDDSNLLIQRTLPYGTMNIAEAIISIPVFNVSTYKDAMEMLVNETVINPQFSEESYEAFDEMAATADMFSLRMAREQAKDEVTASLKTLISNINRVLDYFTTKYPNKKVGTIYITGECVEIKGLDLLFRNELGVEVKILSFLENVTFDKKLLSTVGNQSSFISCIGAPLLPIDFTPKEYDAKHGGSDSMHFPVMILAICVTGAIAMWISSYFVYTDKVREKNDIQAQIDEIKDIEQIYNQYQIAKSNVENMQEMHNQTYAKSQTFLVLLEEIEAKTPNISTAANFSVTNETVTLSISSDSKVTCAKYIEQMKTIEMIETVTVSSITETISEDGKKEVTYTVVCDLK